VPRSVTATEKSFIFDNQTITGNRRLEQISFVSRAINYEEQVYIGADLRNPVYANRVPRDTAGDRNACCEEQFRALM